MDFISSFSAEVTRLAGLPGEAVTALLKMIADSTGVPIDDGPDGWLGLVMSGLAGVAAALAVAIVLAVYFRTGYRSARDMVRHGLAAGAVLGLLAFVAYDVRHAALAYLGITPSKPEVGYEIRLPEVALADARAQSRTDRDGSTRLRG